MVPKEARLPKDDAFVIVGSGIGGYGGGTGEIKAGAIYYGPGDIMPMRQYLQQEPPKVVEPPPAPKKPGTRWGFFAGNTEAPPPPPPPPPPVSRLHESGAFNSCGARQIMGFPYGGYSFGSNELNEADRIRIQGNVATFMVLNKQQHDTNHKKLLGWGCRVIAEFYNPVHDNILWMYMWEPRPERSPSNPNWNKVPNPR